jgi:hypothetical protein
MDLSLTIKNLFLFLLILLVSSACLDDNNYNFFAEDYDTLSWDFRNIEKLEVTTVNGNISISPNTRDSLDAVLYRQCWGNSLEDAEAHLDDIEIHQYTSDNTFTLEAEIPDEGRNYVASFDFRVPDLISVDFFIINGDLLAEKVTSDLNFRAQNGSMETRLVTGDIDLEIITGGIAIQDHIGNVKAFTTTGQVYCGMSELSDDQDIRIKTGTGAVTLEVPSDASFTFEISTSLGKMYITGFDDVTYDRNELYFRSGEVNGGRANIFIQCTSGSINLKAVGSS